eukprot:TRINITY_DN108_c1_g1_i4.p1 TRINITY_DN108_c1_g1~~TRINITY_DN108_c1_g1_i4.p1  ORF type:complete len:457 (+),score=103.13 TRINITY_DN108_c1_g1_i4:537-1907(+)
MFGRRRTYEDSKFVGYKVQPPFGTAEDVKPGANLDLRRAEPEKYLVRHSFAEPPEPGDPYHVVRRSDPSARPSKIVSAPYGYGPATLDPPQRPSHGGDFGYERRDIGRRDGPSGVYADYLHRRDPSGPDAGVYIPSRGLRPERRADVSVSPFRGVSAPVREQEVGRGGGRWSEVDGPVGWKGRGGEVMLPASELEKRDRAREYLAELDQQVAAKRIQKEKEKRERDEYERKLHEEAMSYDPFGRPGCGAPTKDHLQSSPSLMSDTPMRAKEAHRRSLWDEPAPHDKDPRFQAPFPSVLHPQTSDPYAKDPRRDDGRSPPPRAPGTSDSPQGFARFRMENADPIEKEKRTRLAMERKRFQESLQQQVEEKKRRKMLEQEREREEQRKEEEKLERERRELLLQAEREGRVESVHKGPPRTRPRVGNDDMIFSIQIHFAFLNTCDCSLNFLSVVKNWIE